MKKEEAMLLAPHRANLTIEYIENILSDNKDGNMEFDSYVIDHQDVCTLSIFAKDLEKNINLCIGKEYSYILYEELFKSLLSTYLEHETIGISKYHGIINEGKDNFYGVDLVNPNGNKVSINFKHKGIGFDEITKNYNSEINEYLNKGSKKM